MYTISSKDVRYSSKVHYGRYVCTMSSMDMFHDHTVYISLDYKRDSISNLWHGILDMYGNKYYFYFQYIIQYIILLHSYVSCKRNILSTKSLGHHVNLLLHFINISHLFGHVDFNFCFKVGLTVVVHFNLKTFSLRVNLCYVILFYNKFIKKYI